MRRPSEPQRSLAGTPVEDVNDATDISDALTYFEGLTIGTKGDWRLPNILELESLIHYDKQGQIIDDAFAEFPGDNDNGYWSSMTYVSPPGNPHTDNAWYVKFSDSTANLPAKSDLFNVRAVRELP